MKTMRIVLAAVILVIFFTFSFYNAQLVQLLFFKYQTPHLPLFMVFFFFSSVFFSRQSSSASSCRCFAGNLTPPGGKK